MRTLLLGVVVLTLVSCSSCKTPDEPYLILGNGPDEKPDLVFFRGPNSQELMFEYHTWKHERRQRD